MKIFKFIDVTVVCEKIEVIAKVKETVKYGNDRFSITITMDNGQIVSVPFDDEQDRDNNYNELLTAVQLAKSKP